MARESAGNETDYGRDKGDFPSVSPQDYNGIEGKPRVISGNARPSVGDNPLLRYRLGTGKGLPQGLYLAQTPLPGSGG